MFSSAATPVSRRQKRPLETLSQIRAREAQSHYNDKPLTSREDRARSQTFSLRRYQNLVKRWFIDEFATESGTMLDLCCGRGGDMDKWKRKLGSLGRVLGVDISETGIAEAKRRYAEKRRGMPFCMFFRADAADARLWQWIRAHRFERDPQNRPDIGTVPGDVDFVTCNFALHYCWDTPQHAADIFGNATAQLCRGGHMVVTIVDWSVLRTRALAAFAAAAANTNVVSFGNDLYNIRIDDAATLSAIFDQRQKQQQQHTMPALPYVFRLVDAVDDCIEYGILPASLTSVAQAAGLTVVSGPVPFSTVVPQETLSPSEREVADLYAAWVFVKTA